MDEAEAQFVDSALDSAAWLAAKLETSAAALRAVEPGGSGYTDAADLFLKRFVDAFEAGRRVFRAGLLVEEVGQDGLTYIDILNLAEKSGVLPSALTWREIGRVRNRVVHEYAMDRAAAARAVRDALDRSEGLLTMLRASLAHVGRRRSEVGGGRAGGPT